MNQQNVSKRFDSVLSVNVRNDLKYVENCDKDKVIVYLNMSSILSFSFFFADTHLFLFRKLIDQVQLNVFKTINPCKSVNNSVL